MPSIDVKSLDSPEETRPFADKGEAAVVTVAGQAVMRGTYEPGWKWSDHVKPIAGTDSCQAPHLMYCISGQMHVAMDDGTEKEIGAGDIASIAPGHDAWVIGDEPVVVVDFGGYKQYAKA